MRDRLEMNLFQLKGLIKKYHEENGKDNISNDRILKFYTKSIDTMYNNLKKNIVEKGEVPSNRLDEAFSIIHNLCYLDIGEILKLYRE